MGSQCPFVRAGLDLSSHLFLQSSWNYRHAKQHPVYFLKLTKPGTPTPHIPSSLSWATQATKPGCIITLPSTDPALPKFPRDLLFFFSIVAFELRAMLLIRQVFYHLSHTSSPQIPLNEQTAKTCFRLYNKDLSGALSCPLSPLSQGTLLSRLPRCHTALFSIFL
jgi:hypothetical protein